MGTYTAIHFQELFVVQQFSHFTASLCQLLLLFRLYRTLHSLASALFPSLVGFPPFDSVAVPRAHPGRSAPLVTRTHHLGGNNPLLRTGPPPAGGAPQYICVSDFVSKIDIVCFPLVGCTTPHCPRRHVPLPVLGQFAVVDKAELLQSLSRMKGTRVAPMIALIQGRN
jgi:hypothetical protein